VEKRGVVVFVQHEAGGSEGICILVKDASLVSADGLVEVVLHHHVAEGVVADEPWSQLVLVELHEPVHEATANPGGWDWALAWPKEIRRSTAWPI